MGKQKQPRTAPTTSPRAAVASRRASGRVGPGGRIGLGILAVLQVTFAFLAFWDLAHRPADEVTGRKTAWVPVILINWVGPAAYFLFGTRR